MDDYERWQKRKQCPFFLFVQNPRASEGTGAMTCTHASPNIGKMYEGKIDDVKKYCIDGKWKGHGSVWKCRILTNFLKESSYQETLV